MTRSMTSTFTLCFFHCHIVLLPPAVFSMWAFDWIFHHSTFPFISSWGATNFSLIDSEQNCWNLCGPRSQAPYRIPCWVRYSLPLAFGSSLHIWYNTVTRHSSSRHCFTRTIPLFLPFPPSPSPKLRLLVHGLQAKPRAQPWAQLGLRLPRRE